jgi:cytochrome c oxidase assembly protein subunit 11
LVSVEFDSNVHNMPWTFKPMVRSLSVHPGEMAQVIFEVANTRDIPVSGQAIASYGPSSAGEFFRKIDCFCFTKQTLAPGESRKMPVVFVIDPKLPQGIPSITLSYTFFEVEGNSKSESAGKV